MFTRVSAPQSARQRGSKTHLAADDMRNSYILSIPHQQRLRRRQQRLPVFHPPGSRDVGRIPPRRFPHGDPLNAYAAIRVRRGATSHVSRPSQRPPRCPCSRLAGYLPLNRPHNVRLLNPRLRSPRIRQIPRRPQQIHVGHPAISHPPHVEVARRTLLLSIASLQDVCSAGDGAER